MITQTNKTKLRKKLKAFKYNSVNARTIMSNLDIKLMGSDGFGVRSVELQYVDEVNEDGSCEVCYDLDNCDAVLAFVGYGITDQPTIVGYPSLMTREI